MPITDNPFLQKTFQTVQMIAQNNMNQQAEQRAQERQLQAEDRANQRYEQRKLKEDQQAEYDSLTQAMADYRKNVMAGAEPDPEQLNSIVNRRNDLIKAGATPRMFTSVPELKKQTKTNEKVTLSPEAEAFYRYPKGTLVSPETRRILEMNFSNQRSINARDKTSGDQTADQKNANDPLVRLANLRKDAQDRYNKGEKIPGDTQAQGIDENVYQNYLKKIDNIERDFRSGKITKEKATAKIDSLDTFDVKRLKLKGYGDKSDKALDELLNLLKETQD